MSPALPVSLPAQLSPPTPVTDFAEAAAIIARLESLTTRHDVHALGEHVTWRSLGSGTPLVLIHGGHGSWLHWVRNIETLAQQHTVYVPDLPGYGASGPMTASPDDLDHLVRVTIASLDQLIGESTPLHLAGFSFGGLVASHIAAQRGQVRKLALLGSAGHGTPRRQTLAMVNWRRSTDEAAMLDDLRHNLQALMIHDPAQIDALALTVHRDACVNTHFRSKKLSQSASVPAVLAPLTVPMRCVWGEFDATAQADLAGPVLQDGRSERAWDAMPGAGHWLMFERPDAVNSLMLAWFTD
ncbi:alpha/beta hydrolase [Pigmentiphaga litoralis]|nr:alpha/beta hydrolase [Pigmentiphaga litoralis]